MRSTFAGLNTAVRGLQSQQIALDTMGHNVSNVNTEGYSRQQVNLATTRSQTYGGLSTNVQIGSGVGVSSIVRKRDGFMDHQYWKANSTLAYSNVRQESMEKIEEIFQEPSDTGINSVFNKFWNSLQTLSTNAADYGTRVTVRSCGEDVVNTIQLAAKQLKQNIADLNDEIDLHIASFNEMSSEVCSLNKQIVTLEVNGDNANDLRDRRDLLIDKMSAYAGLQVHEDEYGSYDVILNGSIVVSRNHYAKLESRTTNDADYGYEIRNVGLQGLEQNLTFSDGEFKAILESRDSEDTGNKRYLNELSLLSQYFLTDFNETHRAGMGMDNSTNNNFFGSVKLLNGEDYDFKNGGIIISPKTGQPEISKPEYWKKGDWLDALTINDVFQTTEGLDKISAKTSLNSEILSNISAPTLTANGAYKGTNGIIATITEGDEGTVNAIGATYDNKAISVTVFQDTPGHYVVNYGGALLDATYDTTDANNKKLSFTVNGVKMTFEHIDNPEAYQYDLKANATTATKPTATLRKTMEGKIDASGIDTTKYDKKEITAIVLKDDSGKYVVDYGGTKTVPATYDETTKTLKFTVDGVPMTFENIDAPEAYKYELQANAVNGSIPTATLKTNAKKYLVSYTDSDGNPVPGIGKSEAVYYNGVLSFSYGGLAVKSEIPNNCKPTDFKYQFSKDHPLYPVAIDANGNEVKAGSKVTVTTTGAYTDGSDKTEVVLKKDKDGNFTYQIGNDPVVAIPFDDVPVDHKIVIKDALGLEITIDVSKATSAGTYQFVLTKNNNASGDNAVNLANLMKKGEVELLGNQSLESHYAVFIADMSMTSQNVGRLAENQAAMVLQIDNWRQSVCGVSIDDEMTDMIRFQRGYGAASRVINTMDEMLDKLINSTGVVGR